MANIELSVNDMQRIKDLLQGMIKKGITLKLRMKLAGISRGFDNYIDDFKKGIEPVDLTAYESARKTAQEKYKSEKENSEALESFMESMSRIESKYADKMKQARENMKKINQESSQKITIDIATISEDEAELLDLTTGEIEILLPIIQ